MYAEKDKEIAFKKMCDSILPEVDTWDDLYTLLDRRFKAVVETTSMALTIDSFLFMHCVFCAMRDLPDEGDIKVLITRALRILTVESEQRLGLEITVVMLDESGAEAGADADEMETAPTLRAKGITIQ